MDDYELRNAETGELIATEDIRSGKVNVAWVLYSGSYLDYVHELVRTRSHWQRFKDWLDTMIWHVEKRR